MKKFKRILLGIFIIIVLILVISVVKIYRFININNEYYKNEKNILIPIFVYHHIVDTVKGPDYMETSKKVFKDQMQGLRKLGYEFIRYEDLIEFEKGNKKLKEKSILVTFDDGGEDNYTNLLPIIKELNIPVAVNIVDNTVGTRTTLNWEQIKKLDESGLVDIYSHSRYHEESTSVKTEKYVEDIEYSHNNIEKHLGKKVTKVFTYPYGIYDEEKIKALGELGYVQNLTDNKINKSKDLNLLKLHREYPLNDSVFKILLKIFYRAKRYN